MASSFAGPLLVEPPYGTGLPRRAPPSGTGLLREATPMNSDPLVEIQPCAREAPFLTNSVQASMLGGRCATDRSIMGMGQNCGGQVTEWTSQGIRRAVQNCEGRNGSAKCCMFLLGQIKRLRSQRF